MKYADIIAIAQTMHKNGDGDFFYLVNGNKPSEPVDTFGKIFLVNEKNHIVAWHNPGSAWKIYGIGSLPSCPRTPYALLVWSYKFNAYPKHHPIGWSVMQT